MEVLFRQQFRRDLRAGRFTMDFAQSAPMALQRIADAGDRSLILILSDINMPGMSGLELLPKANARYRQEDGTLKRLQFLARRLVLACRGLVVQTTLPVLG